MAQGTIIINDEIRIPSDVFDLASFRRWAASDRFPERGHISYLAGDVEVDTSPEEIETHIKVKGDVFVAVSNWARLHDLGEALADGALVVNEGADVANEPDMIFCSWESLESGRVVYRESVEGNRRFIAVLGTPDLIVEVVSKASVRKDTVVLAERYYSAGVQEYWLIDARGPEIDFQILRRDESSFDRVAPNETGAQRSLVLGADALLSRDLNRIGMFRYSLRLAVAS